MSKTAVISLTKQLIYDRRPSFFFFCGGTYFCSPLRNMSSLGYTIEIHSEMKLLKSMAWVIYKSNNDEDDDDLKKQNKKTVTF